MSYKHYRRVDIEVDYSSWYTKSAKYVLKKISDVLIWIGVIVGIIAGIISLVAAGKGSNPIPIIVDIFQGDLQVEVQILSEADRRALQKLERLVDNELTNRGIGSED